MVTYSTNLYSNIIYLDAIVINRLFLKLDQTTCRYTNVSLKLYRVDLIKCLCRNVAQLAGFDM